MTTLSWGETGKKFYETGVEKVVLFVGNESGVAWDGIVSITSKSSGAEATPYYVDGVKYLNIASPEEHEGTIQAYTYPDEFNACDGLGSDLDGLFVGQQTRKSFSLCYKTLIGNDLLGTNYGYKIHIVYNALATPSEHSSQTLNENVDLEPLSWDYTTTPIAVPGFKPSAYFCLDSTKTPSNILANIENILYGTDEEDPRLPLPSELLDLYLDYFDVDGGSPSSVEVDILDGGTP